VDLSAARGAVTAARAAAGEQRLAARGCVDVAARALERAEALASSGNPGERELASWLGTLAADTALAASGCDRRAESPRQEAPTSDPQADELARTKEARRRLEERVAVLARELELTEREVIRTKARLKGLQTKEEAAAAVAEAQILVRRMAQERRASPTLVRCRDLVRRAEQQLREGNFGAAVFFAGRAQELSTGVGREP
jgi:hypothetical protein